MCIIINLYLNIAVVYTKVYILKSYRTKVGINALGNSTKIDPSTKLCKINFITFINFFKLAIMIVNNCI